MRFVDWGRRLIAAVCILAATSCGEAFEPLSKVPPPPSLDVTAVRLNALRLRWSRVDDPDVIGYALERRENLTGAFSQIAAQVPQTSPAIVDVTWLDTDITPDTYYGYRVITVTRFGDRSTPSVVGGTKSPSMPGIEVRTTSTVVANNSVDPDGYELTIAGPDTIRTAIGIVTTRRFSPLRVGTYQVSLGGLIAQCSVNGSSTKSVTVTDTTATTVTPVSFAVTCKDPSRGEIAVTVKGTGKDVDDEVTIDLLGEASDHTLPDSLRVVSQQRTSSLDNAFTSFVNLRPGTYDVTLEGLADNCTVTGAATRTVTVTPLGVGAISFNVSCQAIGGGGVGAGPFFWRNKWVPDEAAPGTRVKLRPELDLTAVPSRQVQGVEAHITYDPSVLRYESSTPGQLPAVVVGTNTPGRLDLIAAKTGGTLPTGVVQIGDFEFTVIGASGASTTTATNKGTLKAGNPPFQDSISVEEGTFTVGTGGTPSNAPPTAIANGPYSGTVGTAVSFTANGSSDSDGTIASYDWAFGDGQSGTGANASHAYPSAGTFTATLTVTDDEGATGVATASVTITAGTSNQPPIAEANGPYSAIVGTNVTLSSAGSHDPDGTITSYAWTLGNGQTATGASPTVSYASAGTYTVVLTVTDDKGATATDQATVTVSPPANSQPMIWTSIFGPVDVVNNIASITVSYDTRSDVPETPGPEALLTFALDSLKWNPAVLQFYSVNLGPNITGTSDQSKVTAGNLELKGTIGTGFQQGLIQIATIRFKIVGSSGAQTTTATYLGTLQGPASTGGYVYNAKTRVVEGTFTVP